MERKSRMCRGVRAAIYVAVLGAVFVGHTVTAPAAELGSASAETVHKQWGKDPFSSPPEPTKTDKTGAGSAIEFHGVISGPTGVVAIVNYQVVNIGDRVNGELVLDIKKNSVSLKRGSRVRQAVLRSLADPQ